MAAVKAHMTMGTYDGGEDGAAAAEAEVASAVDTAFGLEKDLQLALRRSGRIDIMARDELGATVVIELKAGRADRDSIGQILSYMGDLIDNEARVRRILVAREFDARAVSAARAARDIRLVQYGFRFTFDTVAGSAPQG